MVFAINAPDEGEKSFSAFKEKAKAARHPNPADHETADFTPPGAQGSAPPAGTDVPPAGTDVPPSESSAGAPDTLASSSSISEVNVSASVVAPTPVPTADQANVAPAFSTPATRSGALSTVRVPGAGMALTLAGLLAGMLL